MFPFLKKARQSKGGMAPEADMMGTKGLPLFSVRGGVGGEVFMEAAPMFTSSFSAATAAGLAWEARRP